MEKKLLFFIIVLFSFTLNGVSALNIMIWIQPENMNKTCLNNMTLGYTAISEECLNGTCTENSLAYNKTCSYGCDSEKCNDAPYMIYLYIVIAIIIIIFIIGVIRK